MTDRRVSRIPTGPNQWVLGEDIEYEVVREDWNTYQLADGTVLKIKIVVEKISRGVQENGQILYTDAGEPLYNVRHRALVVAQVPETLVRKE